MTLLFKYWRTGAPWGGAASGMVKAGSGCCEAARDVLSGPFVRKGVPVRAGAGLGAFVEGAAGAGDCASPN